MMQIYSDSVAKQTNPPHLDLNVIGRQISVISLLITRLEETVMYAEVGKQHFPQSVLHCPGTYKQSLVT